MRHYTTFMFLAGICLLFSCTKVDDLSDQANITSFQILHATTGVELDTHNITIQDNVVAIPLLSGRKHFPLTLSTAIQFSKTTDKVINTDGTLLDPEAFLFPDVYTEQEFYLIAESGMPHLAKIVLVDNPNAEITGFTLKNYSSDAVSINIRNNYIRIVFKQNITWPITLEPEITKTETAAFVDYKPGDTLVFSSPIDHTRTLTLRAENGDEKEWQVQIVSSIENSDFEQWINTGTSQINIDPIPGQGYGWSTANNTFVSGTTPVPYNGGYAAQIQTSIQDLSAIGLGELITAGTLFTGYFKMNLNLEDLRSMTYMGIPFAERPSSIGLDAKYVAGSKYQQSVKKNTTYELTDISGVDEGCIWVEVLHYAKEKELEYHLQEMEGLTIIGRGEFIFQGSDKSLANWKTYTIPIQYSNTTLQPTHIVIAMTSSRLGDYFIGAQGSTLTVDNVIINY